MSRSDPDSIPRYRFEKQVEIVAKDDEERVAAGVVMVPDSVDEQLDFARADAIAEAFNAEPRHGVMHEAFPDPAPSEIVRNEIIDDPEQFGEIEAPAGSWVIERQYHDDELWKLVSDGVLGAFSIGGTVEKEIEYAPDEVPDDVEYPEGVPTDLGAVELVTFTVREVSDVDHPAVPAAQAVAKAGGRAAHKSAFAAAASKEEFVERMADRGHDDEDAARLWAYLSEHVVEDDGRGEEEEEEKAGRVDAAVARLWTHFSEHVDGQDADRDDAGDDDRVDEAEKSAAEPDAPLAKAAQSALSDAERAETADDEVATFVKEHPGAPPWAAELVKMAAETREEVAVERAARREFERQQAKALAVDDPIEQQVEKNAELLEEIARRAGAATGPTQSRTPPSNASTEKDADSKFSKAWSSTFRLGDRQ